MRMLDWVAAHSPSCVWVLEDIYKSRQGKQHKGSSGDSYADLAQDRCQKVMLSRAFDEETRAHCGQLQTPTRPPKSSLAGVLINSDALYWHGVAELAMPALP